MQSWGFGNVPPVATGKFLEDTKVHQVSPVSTPASTEGSEDGRLTLKDRRLALEQDVAKLRKKHTQEVNLHKALERALQRPGAVGIFPRIPSYLPAKIQKLLAEVAVLEVEVIRLENHVVVLRKEVSDEASKLSSHGTQKQKTNGDSNLSKPGNLSKIRITKEPVKEPTKEPSSGKFSSGLRKTTKGSNDALQQKPRDPVKEQAVSKTSKVSAPAPAHSAAAPDASRRSGGVKGAPPSGPPPARKPPNASDVLSRFQGLQQPGKPTGGTNGKNNLFRQFNSLNWGDSKSSAVAAKQAAGISSPRNSPRAGFSATSNLSVNWSDKLGLSSGSKPSLASSPRSSPRNGRPFTGTSSVQLWEKENLHSAAAKLISKSPRTSKLGLSVDLSSSNVERKSMLGSKGSSALLPSAGRLSNLSIIKEGAGQGTPNRLAEELVRCLVAIYSKLTKFNPSSTVRGSQGSRSLPHSSGSRGKPSSESLRDLYGVPKDSKLLDIGSYKHAQEITADTIDSNGPGSSSALYKRLGTLLEQLEKAALDALSHHEKLAFWINIYNVCMMHAFLERGIPSTPSKVVALMHKAVVNVGGYVLNALTIEHVILRLYCRPKNVRASPWKHFQRAETNPGMNMGMEEIIEHSAYRLDRNEPMLTFALCCGSRSSPALRVYTSSGIESELQIAKREYLQAAVGVSNQQKIHLPKLLEWYMRDFAKDMEGLLDWLCHQLSGPLQASVQDCVNHPKQGVLSQSIEVMPFDFNFRYLFLI